MKSARLGIRLLRREWRSGEVRALAGAVALAVAAITAVGFFTSRVEQALNRQAGELMAADLLVTSPQDIDELFAEQAQALDLQQARTLQFASVAVANERVQLASVKAVTKDYPLRGGLRIAPTPFGADRATRELPPPGQVWVESRLASALGLAVGDELALGERTFRLHAILAFEPDRAGELFNVAPRLLMRLQDVAATGLLAPGSRVKHALLVAGEKESILEFQNWADSHAEAPTEVQGVRDARPELRAALDRGQRFLGLASLVAVMLAAVAVAISARRFAQRHLDQVAVMRCLGAQQGLLNRLYMVQLSLLGVTAGLAGGALGFMAQWGLARVLAGLAGGPLPAPGWYPLLAGVLAGLLILFAFALPPLLALAKVTPARVLRRDLSAPAPRQRVVFGAALAATLALVAWQAGDARLTTLFLAGASVTVAALGLCAWLLIKALQPLRHRVGVSWRFGLTNIVRRARGSTVQVLGFGLGLMALLLLTLVRGDLLQDWRTTLPADAPNQFAINIQTDQLPALRSWFESFGEDAPQLYPMVRGRLVRINDRPVSADDYDNPRAQRLATREFNLSWAAQMQPVNRLVQGHWWDAAQTTDSDVWSVERDIARTLGIDVGDTLTYRIGGREISGEVASLRKVQWESFRPNFFVLARPGALEDYPTTWISSFRLEPDQKDRLTDLVRQFPNLTVFDVEAVMTQVRAVMDRVALAVEYVFGFTLLAGLLVLYAAIQATQDERLQEGAILRTLGASRGRLLMGVASEFVVIGILAGLLAALGATLAAYVIATQLLDLPFHLRPAWWLTGTLAGGLGVGLAGTLGARKVISEPPLRTLRRL